MLEEELIGQATPKIWMAAGGTYAITLAGVADTEARAGVVGDLNVAGVGGGAARFPPKWAVELSVELAVAPVAGTTVELWWAPSRDGATFAAGITGLDEDWQTGDEAEFKVQLILIGALVLTADVQPVVQRQTFVFRPPTRYGCPVVLNAGGQAFENNDDVHRIIFTPVLKASA